MDGKPVYSVTDACMAVGISLATYANRKKRGDKIPLPDVKIGRRVFYTPAQLEELRRYYEANREWQRPAI